MAENMNPKLHLIKQSIAIWTLLGVTISMLLMFLLAGPGDMCATDLAPINNNAFGEYWIEIILMMNAIIWGIGFWVWSIKNYLKPQKPKDEEEWE